MTLQLQGGLAVATPTTLTISSGVVTQTQVSHVVASEGGGADDLDTITPLTLDSGFVNWIVIQADTGDTVTLKHETGNISLGSGADMALTAGQVAVLFYDGTNWIDNKSSSGSSPLTTKGDLYTYDSSDQRLAVGTNDQALIADSAQATGIKWGTLPIAGGGTGQTAKTAAFDALAPTTTKGDIIAYDGSDNVRLAVGTNGYITIADSAQATGLLWMTPDACRVTHDAAQSIPNNTQTVLNFNTERFDNAGMHNTLSNNSRITIQRAGVYFVYGTCRFASSVTSYAITLFLDGTTGIASDWIGGSDAAQQLTASCIYKFTVSQYIQVRMYQNSGGAVNTDRTPEYSPEFGAIWLGVG